MVRILGENEFFTVLAKPEGWSVHNQSPSVAEFLAARGHPPHFVNRLDQETSGLMLVAKQPEHHAPLARALEHGRKFYRALLRSPWKAAETTAEWTWPISDKSEGHQNPQGKAADRVAAHTRVEVVRSNRYFTEVYVELLTGRQHQIRKHAALAGHPLVGDPRYNERKYNAQIARFYPNPRMHLHAEKLEFEFQGREYVFEDRYDLGRFFANSAT